MAYTERMPFAFQLTPWVKRLMIANAVMLLLSVLTDYSFLERWLAFWPNRALTQPWGFLTYMFLHGGFWHLFWNMVGLFFFGPPLESRWGSREFIKYYLICGLGGAALSLFFPAPIVGASAAVYGVMLAFAMNWPDAPIYLWGLLPVKAKWFVGFLFVASLFSSLSGGGGGIAHLAHLGGLVTGFLYLKSDYWKPTALSTRTSRPRPRRLAIVPREERAESQPARPTRGRRDADEERLLDEVDRVLDKISAQGMESLTDQERSLLDQVSRMHRSN
ncbi:MAG: rhomboid family intramembrane serine protease [Gemmatimonadota bacterium]